MSKTFLRRAVAASLALTACVALVGCNESATGGASTTQPRTVAREECHDEVTTHTAPPKDDHQIAGTAIGAVVGGVLGNQFGSGDGKKLATVGGAVAGGYAGNRIQENNQKGSSYQETKRICKTVYDKV